MRSRIGTVLIAACAAAGIALLGGCKGDAQFSQKEVQQFQSGPPREMPPQAREAMQRGMRGPKGGPPPQGAAGAGG